jgi:hypothetical protein
MNYDPSKNSREAHILDIKVSAPAFPCTQTFWQKVSTAHTYVYFRPHLLRAEIVQRSNFVSAFLKRNIR